MRKNWWMSALVAVSLATVGVGCGGETEGSVDPSAPRSLISNYDDMTVVGEVDDNGVVTATARNASGHALLVLRVAGHRMEIAPSPGAPLAPWAGDVPPEVLAKNDLADWNLFASAYADGLRPEASRAGGITPQMLTAGTEGQMCIAAGGTTLQCAYWLYCRKHWCPLW